MLKYCQDRTHGTNSLGKILGTALTYIDFLRPPRKLRQSKQLMKDNKIRKTKRTENYFTPIVKLIFAGEAREKEKSLVMRCASTLRLANRKKIKPDDIAKFVTDQGGIVQCYKKDREAHRSATEPHPIAALRQNALKCTPTVLQQLMSGEPVTALLDVDQDADVVLLGRVTRYRQSRRPRERMK